MLYAQNSLISMFDLLQEPALKITDNILKDNTEKLNFINSLFFFIFSLEESCGWLGEGMHVISVVQLWLKKPGLLMVFSTMPRAHLPSISMESATKKIIRMLSLSASLWLSWVLVKSHMKCQFLEL